MVVLSQGGIIFRNAVSATITYAQFGSGTSTPTVTQTGLDTAIAASQKAVTKASSGQSIAITHELLSTDANSNTLTEFAVQSGSTALTRLVTSAIIKDSTKEIQTIKVMYVDIN